MAQVQFWQEIDKEHIIITLSLTLVFECKIRLFFAISIMFCLSKITNWTSFYGWMFLFTYAPPLSQPLTLSIHASVCLCLVWEKYTSGKVTNTQEADAPAASPPPIVVEALSGRGSRVAQQRGASSAGTGSRPLADNAWGSRYRH